ncbi:hydroxymethylbilane synthase [Flavobacteriales bacterium]|nr:hydroxymethylbilane synthase [Flavobacteriales bacterium]
MPDSPHYRIGTRGSDLALWQAHYVRDLIAAAGGSSEITVLSTQGDREQVQSFEKLEGKGFFTKEIEEALLEDRIDIAVHSHKDLETQQPRGLSIVAVPARASQRDALLIRKELHNPGPWLPLPQGATVGTSSVRRRDQLLLLRPDLKIQALRGNVPTRVRRLQEGLYDAIVLAEAGLDRLAIPMDGVIRHSLEPRSFVPAPAQGALALQMRDSDPKAAFLAALTDPSVQAGVRSERAVLRALEGGCQLPFGAHWNDKGHTLRCFLQSSTGPRRIVAPHAEDALTQLSSTLPFQALITRSPRTNSVLSRLANGCGATLIESPLIAVVPVKNPAIPESWKNSSQNWVWLGSPGACEAAQSWLTAHPQTLIAVPGNGTAESLATTLLPRLGYVGTGHPAEAWHNFARARTPLEHVAVPHGTYSLKRWNTGKTKAIVHAWTHYDSVPNGATSFQADVVCFTSPSNVNTWPTEAPSKAVAIGPTTSAALTAKGWAHTTAESPDAFGLWEAILRAEST